MNLDLTQMYKLAEGLDKLNISYTVRPLFGGMQILCEDWDAICHEGSYGHEHGLIEIMGSIVENEDDSVEGYLTADDVLSRLTLDTDEDKCYTKDTERETDMSDKFKESVIMSRANLLAGMDAAVRNMNDEDAMDTWLMVGVPDEASYEDLIEIASDHEAYIEIAEVFMKLVKRYAAEDF